ncbi:MAG: 3-deoxy-7-phosphoheptulonate synthase, partial [Clostridia bacterium]
SKGAFQSNFSDDKLDEVIRECDKLGLQKPFIMVDCAHANSAKDIDVEISNALSVVKNRRVNGIMIESYLYGGVSDYEYGTSKTDPCLDWNTTERLIIDIYKLLP